MERLDRGHFAIQMQQKPFSDLSLWFIQPPAKRQPIRPLPQHCTQSPANISFAVNLCYAPQRDKEEIVPELSFVSHIARTIYGLEPQSIAVLAPYCSDQRGIYQVHDAQDDVWMFRLLRSVYLSESLLQAGQLLEWLTQHRYPAPRVRRTLNQQWVGIVDDWAITVLTYVDGTLIGTQPTELTALAQMLGRLHRMPVDESHR
jgi:hypothetical protein